MSERFDVAADERGLVRVFTVDIAPAEIDAFDPASALGVETLDTAQVEVFPLSDLRGLGLSGYMREGLGIAESEIDAARLDALEGVVLILRSAAFGGAEVTVTPQSPLRWIGTYREETAPVRFEPLPDASARGAATPDDAPKRPSDAAMSGRVAGIPLLVIFALTAIVVWIA